MGSLIDFIVEHTGWSAKIARLVATAALIVTIAGACTGLVLAYNHHVIGQHQAKLEHRAKPATDKATQERAHDTIAQAKNEQEKHDAIHSVPDAGLAGPSHALACKRLHDLGRNPSSCR